MYVVVRSRYWADNVWQSAQDKTCPYEICIVQPINGAKNSTFPHDIAGMPSQAQDKRMKMAWPLWCDRDNEGVRWLRPQWSG